MARIVMKFGGTSVADIERIRFCARHIRRERLAGHQLVVVVSAQAGETNKLVARVAEAADKEDALDALSAKERAAHEAVEAPPAKAKGKKADKAVKSKAAAAPQAKIVEAVQPYDLAEYDAVVSSGEQVSAGLLALALQAMGLAARSFAGWQVPVRTDAAHSMARVEAIDAGALEEILAQGQIAVVAGFQGVGADGRLTTLGRGGSDTSAVALAAALKADRCDIYTDVDGVYTTDPRVEPKAKRLNRIAFEEMLEMASLGAKVMQVRSVELAMVHKVRTFVRCSFAEPDDEAMYDFDAPPGTLICDEEEILEQQVVTGIAFARDEAQISLRRLADRPGVSAAIFGPLAQAGVNVDMIVQNVSEDANRVDMTFTVPKADLRLAVKVLERNAPEIGYDVLQSEDGLAKVSVIGIGMRSHAGVAATAFQAMGAKGINIRAITTSEIKISILIDSAYTELAVRTLHGIYGLDKI